MAKFTIYRDSWLRDEPSDDSRLLRECDNKMCCLGQIGFQSGIPLDTLRGIDALPACVIRLNEVPTVLSGLVEMSPAPRPRLVSTNTATKAMQTNDRPNPGFECDDLYRTDAERETALTDILKEVDIEIEFVDGVAPWFAEVTNNV